MLRCLSVGVGLLGVSLAAQQQFVVDRANRPGATHTTIQAACDAAVAGDRILVRRDGSTAYAGFLLTVGVEMSSDSGDVLVDTSEILDLPFGQWARVEGLRFEGQSVGLGLGIRRCIGSVLLRGIRTGALTALLVEDSWSVIVQDAECTGATVVGADVLRSLVTFERCTVRSLGLFHGPSGPPSGLRVVDGVVVVHDSLVEGGMGTAGQCGLSRCLVTAGPGGAGVVASGTGRVVVTGGSTLRGGAGGPGVSWCRCVTGPQGPATVGAVRVDPSVVVDGGSGGALSIPLQPSLLGIPDPFVAGTNAPVQVRTHGHALVAIAVDIGQGRTLLPGVELPWQLGLTAMSIATSSADAAGVAALSIGMPNSPALLNLELLFQAGSLVPGGVIQLSNVQATQVR